MTDATEAKAVVEQMERLNVTSVVFGSPESVQKWRDAAPKRVIPGTSFMAAGKRVPVEQLRIASGRNKGS